MKSLQPVLKRLKSDKIHIAIATCLFTPMNALEGEDALHYIDFFYIDVKILDKDRCRRILHGELNIYISNMDKVLYSGKPFVLRIPVIGGYTDLKENRRAVINFIMNIILEKNFSANLLKIELIKEYNLGIGKYESLAAYDSSVIYPKMVGVSGETMNHYKEELAQAVLLCWLYRYFG